MSELQTFSALKTLIEDTAQAANTIQAYGAADSSAATPEPTEDDYAAIGVTGVTSLNVAAINSSLAEANVLDTITSSVAAEAQDIVNTWAKVQALADGETDTKDVSTSYVDFMPTFSSSTAIADGVTYTVSANDLWIDGWGTYHAYFAFDGGTADRNSWIADLRDGYDTLTVTTDDANGFKIGKYSITHHNYYTYEGWNIAGQYFDGSEWVWETIDSFATSNGGDEAYKNTTQTYYADLSISDQHNYQNFRFEITDSWAHTPGWYALPELTIFKAEETVSANNSLSLSVSDFELLGVRNNGAPITAIEANYLSHLLDKGEISDINAVEKIQNYYNALHALLTTADQTAVSDVTREQLNLLGITLVNSDARYTAILGHIKAGTKSGSSSVAYDAAIFDHFSEIRNELVATITGLTIVERAAEFDAATASNPTVGDYYGVNALSSNGASVTSSNLAAVNSMLNTSAVTGAIAADPAALRVLVGYYQEILTAAADVNAAGTLSLSVDNYQSIGLVGFSSNSAKADIQAALLNDVIESKTAASAVDRIAEVQALSDAVVSVLRTVDGETPAITQAELELLGFAGVTTNNLSAIQKALSDVDTSSNYDLVDTLSEVTAIVNNAIAALEAVKTEAGANDGDSVTASQLVAMGVEGAVETGSGANMALINS
ncbi:hypothetical protein, partial [Roseobacter sp. HKCCA2468]|uniref:hypothetical protein n=1 Tax=Roseobacter sp. HKCCA2468 TaxID=3120342 RepID=UPI0030ED8780